MRRVTLVLLALGLAVTTAAHAANPVRISQVYTGGGGTYSCDYVELFNNSSTPVDIGGWSVQYGSATGSSFGSATYNWAKIPSGAAIPACGYYLIRGYCSTAGTALSVTPDLVPSTGWTFNLGATDGKVALFGDQVAGRTCATAQSSGMLVDLVGYGTANCYETAAAPASGTTSVLVRALGGVTDTDDNSGDFTKVAASGVTPHNSASAPNPSCGQGAHPPDAPTLVGPLEGSAVAVPVTLTVTVSDPDADALTVQFYGRALPPPPAVPVATAATGVSSSSFQANWNASSGATSYRLDVATDSGFGTCVVGYQDLAVAGTSRTVFGLVPETPYYYRVRAVNDGGTSGNSNIVTVTTGTAPPPATECELILLPDTQEYTTQEKGGIIQMFQAQTQWIVDNRAEPQHRRRGARRRHHGQEQHDGVRPRAHRDEYAGEPGGDRAARRHPVRHAPGQPRRHHRAVQPVLRRQPVRGAWLLRRALRHRQRPQLHASSAAPGWTSCWCRSRTPRRGRC